MKKPCVSVVMCVYNGEDYLAQALDSVQGQSFTDWECVVVDDGSTDGTPAILADYTRRDGRFRICRNERNLRLQASLNRGLALAEGRYLLRMDADDVSRGDRMERQVAFMEAHPEVDLSGCRAMLWKKGRVLPGLDRRRGDPEAVRALFLFFNPIVHPGVIVRREALEGMEYDTTHTCTEDLDLWIRLLLAGKTLAVQEDYLLLYRLHDKQITANTAARQREEYRETIRRFYAGTVSALKDGELELLTHNVYFRDQLDLPAVAALLDRVRTAGRTGGRFDTGALNYAAAELLMEYRRAGSSPAVLRELARLGAGFWADELPRRLRAARRDRALRSEALAVFEAGGIDLSGGNGQP